MRWLLFLTVTVFFSQVLESQSSEAFLVYILDRKVKVISPLRHSSDLHVILRNQTLSRVRGKIQTEKGRVIDHVSLGAGESKSVSIGHVREKRLFYYSLAPAFQEVELVVGKVRYEIPPKK